MLITAKKFAVGEQTFAFWQMHTTMGAANHIFTFNGRRLFMCFFLPLFQSAPIAPYCPENKHGNKAKE